MSIRTELERELAYISSSINRLQEREKEIQKELVLEAGRGQLVPGTEVAFVSKGVSVRAFLAHQYDNGMWLGLTARGEPYRVNPKDVTWVVPPPKSLV